MEKNQRIMLGFQRFLAKRLQKNAKNKQEITSFIYEKDEEKQSMVKALLFWVFLREFSQRACHCNDKKKLDFISYFLTNSPLANENKDMKIVAMIEALPTSIWRKLLWRENIDFSDYEPCLRRLSEEQRQAIEDNYNDLFNSNTPAVPRVLKKSWRDRVKLFFGVISVDKILKEEYDAYQRNKSKASYAFSLLGLDFGFSLYPQGDNDDTRITNKKYTRFFSVKEHINDFVVNQEDGKYWWLYKSARSNYAINPDKDVQMKTHVCPGFWWTLTVHTLFWIASPISLIVSGVLITKNGLSESSLMPAIFALPLIIWSAIATLRATIKGIKTLTKKSFAVRFVLIAALVVVVGSGVAVGIYRILAFILDCVIYLTPIYGTLLSALFVLTVCFYIFFTLSCLMRDNPLFEYNDVPKFVRFILHATLVTFFINVFDRVFAESVLRFITKTSTALWKLYTNDLLLSNWLIISFLFFAAFIYFYRMFLNNEKRFASLQKTFTWLTKGFLAITLIVFTILLSRAGHLYVSELGIVPAFSLALIFLSFSASLIMLDVVNPNNIKERIIVLESVQKINQGLKGLTYKNYVRCVLQSKWLLSLEERQRWSIVDEIHDLAFRLLPHASDYRLELIYFLTKKGNLEAMNVFRQKIDSRFIYINDITSEEVILLCKFIVKGLSVEQAMAKIENKRIVQEKIKDKILAYLKMIATPFILLWQAITWIFKKIGQFFGTLGDLWTFFNKRCPFISQSRYLG